MRTQPCGDRMVPATGRAKGRDSWRAVFGNDGDCGRGSGGAVCGGDGRIGRGGREVVRQEGR